MIEKRQRAMKITAINRHKYLANTNYTNQTQSSHAGIWRNSCSLFLQRYSLPCDSVSFGASRTRPVSDLRLIPNITCACCGAETIPNGEIDSFMEKKIYYPADKAIKVITASGVFNKNKLTKSQYQAYEFCKLVSALYEGETLSNILDREAVQEKVRLLPKDVRENIKSIETMTRRVFHNSAYMVNELKKFEPRMNKTEKEAFLVLKDYSEKYPNKSFTEIFNEPYVLDTHLEELEKEQGKVLYDADMLAQTMSKQSKKKIHNLVKRAYNILINETPAIKNKRSRIIEMFEKAEADIPEKDIMNEIIKNIYKLPSSRNNVNAFIVKYRDNNPNEIADLILRGSSSTIEHVKPHKRPNDPGENDIKNYIVLCKDCNQERQQIPYSEFIKKHPDMPENTQKYLDKVIEHINNGLLIGFDKYPLEIKKTVEKESAGKIKLSYIKLNVIKAAENRKKFERKKK